jgi:hypothetical protein
VCYTPLPHHPWCDHHKIIWWRQQTMNLSLCKCLFCAVNSPASGAASLPSILFWSTISLRSYLSVRHQAPQQQTLQSLRLTFLPLSFRCSLHFSVNREHTARLSVCRLLHHTLTTLTYEHTVITSNRTVATMTLSATVALFVACYSLGCPVDAIALDVA